MKIKFDTNQYSLEQVGKGHWYSLTRVYFIYDCKDKTLKLEQFNIINRFIRSIFSIYQSSHLSRIAKEVNLAKIENPHASDCFWEIYRKKYPASTLGPKLQENKPLSPSKEKEINVPFQDVEVEEEKPIIPSPQIEKSTKPSILESAGIHNNGSNCSFNAFLQSVKVLPQFRQWMEQALTRKEGETEEKFLLRKQLQSHFLDLMKQLESTRDIEFKEINAFRKLIADASKEDNFIKGWIDIGDIVRCFFKLFDYPFWQVSEYDNEKIEKPHDIYSYINVLYPSFGIMIDKMKFKQTPSFLILCQGMPDVEMERKSHITLIEEDGTKKNYQLVSFCTANNAHIVCYLHDEKNNWVKFDGAQKYSIKEESLSYSPKEVKMLFYAQDLH